MPIWLDTRGKSTLTIGICGRCKEKFSITELFDDINYPGLKVCADDRDHLDKWRLPARELERIAPIFARPDAPLGLTYSAAVPVPLPATPIDGIGTIGPAAPWQPNNGYPKGASITPVNVDNPTVGDPVSWFLCTVGGTSGATPPVWPTAQGTTVEDGTVAWLNLGLYTA